MVQYLQLKNTEIGYQLVKWKSESFTFLYSQNLGNNFINDGELVFDALYFNTLDNFKQWYTPYEN